MENEPTSNKYGRIMPNGKAGIIPKGMGMDNAQWEVVWVIVFHLVWKEMKILSQELGKTRKRPNLSNLLGNMMGRNSTTVEYVMVILSNHKGIRPPAYTFLKK